MIRKVEFTNGMRVVAERMSSVKSVSIGLWVNIGSRDEEAHEHGISHFLEHMFFKGTALRSAGEIAQEIDAIGGEINAFTSRENTTFYAKVLTDHLPKAVEILSDNFHHSKFDPREIEKEKQVVIEEIKMVEDDPEDLVHTLHIEDTLKGSPLGRTILGTIETLNQMNRKKIIHFLERTYDPKQIVIAVAGRFDFDTLIALLQKAFGSYQRNNTRLIPRISPAMTPQFQVKKRKLEQVHLCISTPGLAITHPQREALHLLNIILGGGVSSHLFQEVREQRGLAYSIYSSPSFYQGGGLFTIYAGTGAKNAPKVVELIFKEIRKMKEKGVAAEELKKAKEHIKGNILLSTESSSSRMSRLAKDELSFGRQFKLTEVIGRINRVTLKSVYEVANTLFHSKSISLTALGPVEAHTLPGPSNL
ncbi:MAG: insulinase family protein [Nitrospirae bacterium]|nr:insulinase family protein [Candidatus Troglogloeales bacterium]